jgi:hypothetical protein
MDDLKFCLNQGEVLGPAAAPDGAGAQRSQYRVRMIRAGRDSAQGNRQSDIEIPAEVLRQGESRCDELLPEPGRRQCWRAAYAQRDPQTGELLHDNLLISAALYAVLDGLA